MSNGIRKRAKPSKIEILELDPRLLDAIKNGSNVTGIYNELPLEDLLVLDTMSSQYPGLRFVLRRQRGGRYLLTVLATTDITKGREDVKGAP